MNLSDKIGPIINDAIHEYFGNGYQLVSPLKRIHGPGYDTKWHASIRTPYGSELELLSEDKMLDIFRSGRGVIDRNVIRCHGNYFFSIK